MCWTRIVQYSIPIIHAYYNRSNSMNIESITEQQRKTVWQKLFGWFYILFSCSVCNIVYTLCCTRICKRSPFHHIPMYEYDVWVTKNKRESTRKQRLSSIHAYINIYTYAKNSKPYSKPQQKFTTTSNPVTITYKYIHNLLSNYLYYLFIYTNT